MRITASGFVGLWQSMAALTVRDALFGFLSRREIEEEGDYWAWSAMAAGFGVEEERFRRAIAAISDEYSEVLASIAHARGSLHGRFAAAREMCRRFGIRPVQFDSWYRGARDTDELWAARYGVPRSRFDFGLPIDQMRRSPLIEMARERKP